MDKFVVSLPRGAGHKRKNAVSGLGSAFKKQAVTKAGGADSNAAKPQQMFLDLGQKTFGATMQCPQCNMFFIKGDLEDEKRHKAFCTQFNRNPTIQGCIEDKFIVENIYDDLGGCQIAKPTPATCQVVLLKGPDLRKMKIKEESLRHVLDVVQGELGSTLDLMSTPEEHVLLYLKDKETLGVAVTEPVPKENLVAISSSMKTTDVNVDIQNKSENRPKLKTFGGKRENQQNVVTPEPKVAEASAAGAAPMQGDVCSPPPGETLGIKLIWVAKSARKRGIAAKLIDNARKVFTYGSLVKREHVAFSQPTDDGLALARHYTRKDAIWSFC